MTPQELIDEFTRHLNKYHDREAWRPWFHKSLEFAKQAKDMRMTLSDTDPQYKQLQECVIRNACMILGIPIENNTIFDGTKHDSHWDVPVNLL